MGPEQLLSIYRLSDPALSELGLELLLDELLTRIREILEVDTAAVLLVDESDGWLAARAAKGLEEEVEEGVRIPPGKGFAGRIAAERAPIFIADVNHADVFNPILRRRGVRSLLGVPLVVQGKLVGVLHVGTLAPRTFTNEEAALLQLAAARAAPAIERAELFDALEREHRGAVGLQRSLLPDQLPDIAGVDVAARYLPARDEVGGDWYDTIELTRSRVGIAIGDVAGHGVRAAALMGQLRTGMRAYALDGNAPPDTLQRLDQLLQTIRGRSMATVAYGVFDTETGELELTSAGHPPPVIIPAEGPARLMEVRPAPPLGTLPYAEFPVARANLAPGDTILLYTDGLVETRDEPLTAGFDRLCQAARAPVASADDLCERVIQRLVDREGAADDVAVLALRSLPIEPRLRLRLPADPGVLASVRRLVRRWLAFWGAGERDAFAVTLATGEACAGAIERARNPARDSFEVRAVHDDGVATVTVRGRGGAGEQRSRHDDRRRALIEASVDELQVRTTATATELVMRKRLGN